MAVVMFILYLAAAFLVAVEGQYNDSTLVLVHAVRKKNSIYIALKAVFLLDF